MRNCTALAPPVVPSGLAQAFPEMARPDCGRVALQTKARPGQVYPLAPGNKSAVTPVPKNGFQSSWVRVETPYHS